MGIIMKKFDVFEAVELVAEVSLPKIVRNKFPNKSFDDFMDLFFEEHPEYKECSYSVFNSPEVWRIVLKTSRISFHEKTEEDYMPFQYMVVYK